MWRHLGAMWDHLAACGYVGPACGLCWAMLTHLDPQDRKNKKATKHCNDLPAAEVELVGGLSGMVDRQEAYRPSAQRESSANMGGYNEKETCQKLTNIRRAMAAGFKKRGYPRKALAWMWLAVANLASFSVHSIDKEAARDEGPAERWTRSTMSRCWPWIGDWNPML